MNRGKFILLAAIMLFAVAKPSEAQIKMKVATFNIRLATKDDGKNYWEYRKKMAAEVIKKEKIDIFGTQEVLHNQLIDLLTQLPQYGYIGVGRADGKEGGEYSAIMYNKEKLRVIESNTYWLHPDTSAVGQKGWDAACERVVTWGLFEEIKTGKQFYMMNTHFDHVGKVARQSSADLIVKKATEMCKHLPLIVTGDFNATIDTDVYQILSNKTNSPLIDARTLAKKSKGYEWSFHGFGKVPLEKRVLIDYLFVTKGAQVASYESIFKEKDGVYISDHNPLVISVTL